MTITQAKRAALDLLGDTAWVERYPAKQTTAFGVTHVAVAQFAIGRTLYNGGREVLGRGLCWEEAFEHATERVNGSRWAARRNAEVAVELAELARDAEDY